MWRLLLSGLLCVPALVLLALASLNDSSTHLPFESAAPIVAVARAEAPSITISLPPTRLLAAPGQTDLDGWELASIGYLAATPAAREPARPHQRPMLHARAAVRRDAAQTHMAQATLPPQQQTLLVRVGRWFAEHQAPKIWSPGGGEGAG